MDKILWLIALILILLSGFKMRINDNYFEWVGLLEQVYNCTNKKHDKELSDKREHLELLKQEIELISKKQND